eukprot:805817-Ditylum_brightwellii.AAC.1
MVWLQIQAKSKSLIGSSEESDLESKEEDDKEEDLLQDLLTPNMAQRFPSLLAEKKSIIELEDNS